MHFKKSFVLMLSAFMMFSCVSIPASAATTTYISNEEIAPAYEYAVSADSMLSISSGTATCTSFCSGSSDVVQITVEQTLQKFWGLWIWNDVDGAEWSATNNSSYVSAMNTKTGLSDGKYRVKSVFTLTSSSGKTETITVYSVEKTIP